MTARRTLTSALALTCVVAACSSVSGGGATGRALLHSPTTTTASTTTSTTTPARRQCDTQHLETASLRPEGPMPAPANMPAGSFMARIQQRGRLIAGVDQTTLGFGYRDATGQIEGFDVDLLHQVAAAIFGNPNKIEFRAVTSQQRETAVRSGAVDIVASLMSMTCARWEKELFSSEYYAGAQNVLVRNDSPIHTIADLNGKTVCATQGSTSIVQIRQFAPGAQLDPVATRAECLVDLQDGTTDAISTDDTILWGFQYQDPNTRLLQLATPNQLHAEPYGMAINRSHPEFVRFVNAVLERVRADGTWESLYDALRRRFAPRLIIPAATPPEAVYRNEP
jgi:polar amino acid transport system substrate-binding protein